MLPSMLDREKFVTQELETAILPPGVSKVDLLLRAVAVALVRAEMFSNSQIAFGSQVQMLVAPAGSPVGIPMAHARKFYDAGAAAFPHLYNGRSFEDWLRWPTGAGLVLQEVDRLKLTQLGADFLKFLVDERLAYERHG